MCVCECVREVSIYIHSDDIFVQFKTNHSLKVSLVNVFMPVDEVFYQEVLL